MSSSKDADPVRSAEDAGTESSIQEAQQTLQQLDKMHLSGTHAISGGTDGRPVSSDGVQPGSLSGAPAVAPAVAYAGGVTGALRTGPAAVAVDSGNATGGPPPIAEALAPIADDGVPPPPADPTPKDDAGATAGLPEAPRATSGIVLGLSHGSGNASADATSGNKTAASGSTQGAQGDEGGGILATIGSYLGMGGGDNGAQDTSPAAGAHPEQQGKPGGTGGLGTTSGGCSTSASRGATGPSSMTAAMGVEGEAGEPGTTMAPGSIGGHRPAGAAAGSSGGGSRGGGRGGDRDAPSGYEWLADLLDKMWPYITEAVNKEAKVQLPDLIKASKPTWMGDITLHKFKLGGAPPALTDIRVVEDAGAKGLKGDDYIHLELDFDWNSSQDVELDVSLIPEQMKLVPKFVSKAVSKATAFRCGVENFEMFGNLMIAFRPLMHQMPIVGAIQVNFLEAPDFDFDITMGTAGAKVLDTLPMLKTFLYGFISDTLLAPYILPDHFFYPIDPAAPDYQIPVGYVEVEVVEAKNIPKMDYLASSDPYVQVSTHKRGAKRTKIGSHPKHPHWNETFKLPINVPRYQHLTAVLYDEDYGGDDEVGRVIYPVRDLKPNDTQDLWLPVKPLLKQDKDEGGEDNKKKRRKRDRLRSAITKPLGPADPEHKGTALHLRMTYKECTEDQVRAVMEAEQKKTPIKDRFMADLLKEDEPAGVVAGDRAQQTNPAPSDHQETEADKQKKAEQGEPQVMKKGGVDMLEQRARPESADPRIAATGEVEPA